MNVVLLINRTNFLFNGLKSVKSDENVSENITHLYSLTIVRNPLSIITKEFTDNNINLVILIN